MRQLRQAVLALAFLSFAIGKAIGAEDAASASGAPGAIQCERGAIISAVIDIVREHTELPRSLIVPKAKLRQDLRLDGLDRVELEMAFEEALHVTIPALEDPSYTVFDKTRLDPTKIQTIGEVIEAILRACGDPTAMSEQDAIKAFRSANRRANQTILGIIEI